MKRLILTLLVALLFAAPAVAEQPRTLLAHYPINVTFASLNDLGECIPFGTEYYTTTYCSLQYGGWLIQRDLTITEIQVNAIITTGDMGGHCALQFVEDTNGDDDWIETVGEQIYFDVRGVRSPGYVTRKAVDIDFTRGQMVGLTIQNFDGMPSYCWSETTDPVIQVYIWGYYTD